VVPTSEPTFIYRALVTFGIVKPESPITAPVVAPAKGITVEYGEYLAWRTSGCAECHMPRDMNTGELDFTRRLAGSLAPHPEEGISPLASNLTPDAATGIGSWTEEQFMTAMRKGQRPDGTVILPFMPWPSYGRWTDDDLKAVWLYLRTLPAVNHPVRPSTLSGIAADVKGVARGEALFATYCRVCHGDKGVGAPLTHAVLKDAARGINDQSLTRFISEGMPGGPMPGFGKTFTDEDLTDLIQYIRSW
jgi:mono/diheme cytochrome c family protein